MPDEDALDRIFLAARTKTDLHRAIDALPEDAKLIMVSNACCCGDPAHAAHTGEVIYHASFGEPSLVEALGLIRLVEHRLIATTSGED